VLLKAATSWRSIHAAPRLYSPLLAAVAAQLEPQSSQILRAACVQPAAQSPGVRVMPGRV